MASPLEKMKQGIIKRDWKLVASAYKDFTGETLVILDDAAPTKAKKKKEVVSDKIVIDGREYNEAMVPQPTYRPVPRPVIEPEGVTARPREERSAEDRTEAKSESVRTGKRVNMFFDDMTEAQNLIGK